MRINVAQRRDPLYTHEGTRAEHITPIQQLRRSVLSCFLWEGGFYEDGVSIAERITTLCHAVLPEDLAELAVEARNKMKLRHVPLLLARELVRHPRRAQSPSLASHVIAAVIQRPDELSEFLALYWKDGKSPLAAQVKKGLAMAFQKFDEYQFAKWNRDASIKLRDVLFLSHAKPADSKPGLWNKQSRKLFAENSGHVSAQRQILESSGRGDGFSAGELLFGKLTHNLLATPDTWEVELSGGADKRETFIRLMHEKKLGDMAFLRNLRNMDQSGVPHEIIIDYGNTLNWSRVLPFRFITAARIIPQLEPHLERWMFKCLESHPRLEGRTAVVIDTSPSMWEDNISAKSDMTRFDAAAALAMLIREVCEDVAVYTFNKVAHHVPPRRGFALVDALATTKGNYSAGGLGVKLANANGYDRIIVLTDGQWHPDDGRSVAEGLMRVAKSAIPAPLTNLAYLIDVSTNENGIGYHNWTHIDGWSESVIDYIQQAERIN